MYQLHAPREIIWVMCYLQVCHQYALRPPFSLDLQSVIPFEATSHRELPCLVWAPLVLILQLGALVTNVPLRDELRGVLRGVLRDAPRGEQLRDVLHDVLPRGVLLRDAPHGVPLRGELLRDALHDVPRGVVFRDALHDALHDALRGVVLRDALHDAPRGELIRALVPHALVPRVLAPHDGIGRAHV